MNYQNIITIEPGKRSGKPCIRGMRITVYDVLSYLASGMTYQEILEDFPYLTQEDILACLSYAADRERQTLVAQAWNFCMTRIYRLVSLIALQTYIQIQNTSTKLGLTNQTTGLCGLTPNTTTLSSRPETQTSMRSA